MMRKMRRMNNSRIKYLKSLYLMQKVVWWMRSFSSSHNKPRGKKEKLGERKMLYFQRIEDDI